MKAVILSAGQGRRLSPLTDSRPKCLLPLNGRSVLEWQLRGLASAGVEEAVIVTGFGAELVDGAIHSMRFPGLRVRALHNPFYSFADNVGSCWAAREEMRGEFLLLNGDTLFEPEIAARLLEAPPAAVTLTINRKSSYDADDMKVIDAGGRLLAVGKNLPSSQVTGESIGFSRFSPDGAARFNAEVEAVIRQREGLQRWYLSVIDQMAREQPCVRVLAIDGLDWGELDYPKDVPPAEAMTARWIAEEIRDVDAA